MSVNKINVSIDGINVQVTEGSSVLQACEVLGLEIPRFCFHERLLIAGNCRMCLVEIEKSPKPQASCAVPAMPGMKVFTNTPLVKKAREGVLEFLLLNHPLDCPICDQGGECDLQDQAMIYGSDRSRFMEKKRGVEDKNLGPLIKTIMTRCIHCTRCVRFATEVAGVEVLGTTSRGIDTEIGTYVEKMFKSELSGNIIDLCPVGALTSKPYAFTSRPWELKTTESIDTLDSTGSNIRIDTRGTEIMRIIPRLNEDINEEWISDKTRFSYDGLKRQRLTRPMVRKGGNLVPVDWVEAFTYISKKLKTIKPQNMGGVLGGSVDVETAFALKEFLQSQGSFNISSEFGKGQICSDFLENSTFNSTIGAIDESDLILLVGCDLRKEAPIINARIRKRILQGNFKIANISYQGSRRSYTFKTEDAGNGLNALFNLANGTHWLTSDLAQAKNPLIIVGSGLVESPSGNLAAQALTTIDRNISQVSGSERSSLNYLQPNASQNGFAQLGLDSSGDIKPWSSFLYCIGVDNLAHYIKKCPDAFIVYQGHHGSEDLSYVDVVLPGAAYTEKDALFFNTEGRPQKTRRALTPPGYAREDWFIVDALNDFIGDGPEEVSLALPKDELLSQLVDKVPSAQSLNRVSVLPSIRLGVNDLYFNSLSLAHSKTDIINPTNVDNFYVTCNITKSSSTMAKCTELLNSDDSSIFPGELNWKNNLN
jgi:NADH dehydrogenase (ubiquinone) Fe-S protein 1